MVLVIDSVTAACSVALIEGDRLLDERHELVGRGHAERLMPMIAELLAGRRPALILVDCGPGSFTGLRVGLAAAHGLAIGWRAPLDGYSSLAAIAAAAPDDVDELAVALHGGHGQLFVQSYGRHPLTPRDDLRSLPPDAAAAAIRAPLVLGSAAEMLVSVRGFGDAVDRLPRAANARCLPKPLRSFAAATDLRAHAGRQTPTMTVDAITLGEAGIVDLDAVMSVMEDSFDPAFGEAWTAAQCAGLLPLNGVWLSVARGGDEVIGFTLGRIVLAEAELLLLAVKRDRQREGIGRVLLERFQTVAKSKGATKLHLEVRDGNPAKALYLRSGFIEAGRRRNYYTGRDGRIFDALTLTCDAFF